EIVFYISIPLLIAMPISIFWYLITLREKKPREAIDLDHASLAWRLGAALHSFLLRHRTALQNVFLIYMCGGVAESIYHFNAHPRASLFTIVYNCAWMLFITVVWEIRNLRKQTAHILLELRIIKEHPDKIERSNSSTPSKSN